MSDLTTSRRIANYAYRFWVKAEMTEWPTVRRVARALRIKQADVDDCEYAGEYTLTGYNCEDFETGDHLVEAMTRDVDIAWCAYWLPLSSGCICGEHTTAAARR